MNFDASVIVDVEAAGGRAPRAMQLFNSRAVFARIACALAVRLLWLWGPDHFWKNDLWALVFIVDLEQIVAGTNANLMIVRRRLSVRQAGI